MDAGINNVIYMEIYSGPKMANGTCGKIIVLGMVDRDSIVLWSVRILFEQTTYVCMDIHTSALTLIAQTDSDE